MKKNIIFVLVAVFLLSITAMAQPERYGSGRLDNYVRDLKRATVDLVDRTSNDLRNGRSNSRSDIEAAFLAVQLDASAGVFDDLVRGNNRANELRDAATILTELVRRAPSYGSNRNLWRDATDAVSNSGNGEGRVYWRGTVDDVIRLEISGRNINVRTVSGRPYSDGTYSFTSPLPTRSVTVGVDKKEGRGNVSVVQQPSRQNGWTTVVEISDKNGGARDYRLEVFWQ
jgi:hypothetical protein